MVAPSYGILAENSVGITIRNSKVTCPDCGHLADFIEGTFDVRGNLIEVVTASEWTRFQLRKYQEALRWAAENYEQRPRAALRRIEKVSPETASFLRNMREPLDRKEILTILFGLITAVGVILANLPKDDNAPQKLPPSVVEQTIVNVMPGDLLERLVPPANPGPSSPGTQPKPLPEAPETDPQLPETGSQR